MNNVIACATCGAWCIRSLRGECCACHDMGAYCSPGEHDTLSRHESTHIVVPPGARAPRCLQELVGESCALANAHVAHGHAPLA